MGTQTEEANSRALRHNFVEGGPRWVGLGTALRNGQMREIAYAGYARQPIQFGQPTGGASNKREVANTNVIRFPAFPARPAQPAWWFVIDSADGGAPLAAAEIIQRDPPVPWDEGDELILREGVVRIEQD